MEYCSLPKKTTRRAGLEPRTARSLVRGINRSPTHAFTKDSQGSQYNLLKMQFNLFQHYFLDGESEIFLLNFSSALGVIEGKKDSLKKVCITSFSRISSLGDA